ncbi:MAG: amino acid adenylation domain-containing protein [Eubacterium sp.]|nr:amino acid adenylation domain-containing protein [Eubacterium sp.]
MMNSVLDYIGQAVLKSPDKQAVQDGEVSYTYQELQKRALQLARMIKDKEAAAKKPILIYLPKSSDSIAAFLGTLYSGNFYTPTDVKFPFEKVNTIITCLQPRLIVSCHSVAEKLISNGIPEEQFIYMDDITEDSAVADPEVLTERIIDCDLAYVLFTSGSTGVPKGVGITHRSIIDFADWAKETFSISSEERIANQTPLYFDMSVLDIYLTFSAGASLYIVPESTFSFPIEILEYIKHNKISFICWVPTVFKSIANGDLLPKVDCSCLKHIFFAGEVMPNKVLNYFRRNLPDAQYADLFGPTEITDICTYYVVNREFADNDPLPIGHPCRNIDAFILSSEDELIEEEGRIGELCIRGTCLAMGYYNNPEMTRKVFVQNPLNRLFEEKIYRTGDLVHYNQYGEFEYDGRKDFQIKHLGYRIELGEIETAVLALPGIHNGCVLYDDGKKEIVLFYHGEKTADKGYIRRQLIDILPKYMLPTVFICLNELPYNDNGKIDRKRLKEEYIIRN